MKLMYQGSEAYRLDAPGEGALAQNSAPSFEVFEGRGLDAQARRGVSSQLVTRLRVLAAVVCALALLGIARVGIYSAAVSVLADNTSIRSDIKDARSTQGDLRVERSVLSSSTRIGRIATQSYGMVAADDPEQMVAGSAEAPAADGSGQSPAPTPTPPLATWPRAPMPLRAPTPPPAPLPRWATSPRPTATAPPPVPMQ